MSEPKIRLRTPKKGEERAILECQEAAIRSKGEALYDAATIESWAPKIDTGLIESVEGEIVRPGWIYLVAESDEGIVGFGIVVPEQHELRAVYVRPNRHGRLGTKILAELLDRARSAGLAFLEMEASKNAVAFYERNGFRVLSRGTHVLSSGATMAAARMRIDL